MICAETPTPARSPGSVLPNSGRRNRNEDEYGDTFKIATDVGGITIATSADGRYVYLVGKKGLIASDDHGKTGSWVQTLKLK